MADNAQLILPIHQELDGKSESSLGAKKIGTTGRGIGPAYEDKVARRGIRVCDLANDDVLKERVDALVAHHGGDSEKAAALLAYLKDIRTEILPYAKPVWRELYRLKKEGKRLLFEGAQGILLDVDHGTYPFVTSSNTVPGNAFTGSGMGVGSIGYILGITKAYTTRVGSGPFPTELDDEIGHHLGTVGKEFGTVTSRKRRCGWFDAVLVRQTIQITGINGIAFTKLDVLDGVEEIKLCIGYKVGDTTYDYLPADITLQEKCEPIYETLPGWSESTYGARSYKDLPANAVKYVRRVEELLETPISLLSTSPDREDTILLHDPFAN